MTNDYSFQPTRSTTRTPFGRWALACLLIIVAVSLCVELCRPTAAEAQISSSMPKRLLAVAGQVSSDTYGLYLVDLENNIITVYGLVPGKPRKFKLMAARNFSYDIQLDEYNTEPSPNEIKRLVQQGRSITAP